MSDIEEAVRVVDEALGAGLDMNVSEFSTSERESRQIGDWWGSAFDALKLLQARIEELEGALEACKPVVLAAPMGHHLMASDEEWHEALRRAHIALTALSVRFREGRLP